MKALTLLLLILIVPLQSHAQSSNLADKLTDYELMLVNKISVGSSPDEVKRILGKPTVVESGFPESSKKIFIDDFPSDMAGQLNYSTWFYTLSKKSITYTVYTDTIFLVNGEMISSKLYDFYLNRDSVYYNATCSINGQPVSIELYQFNLDKDSVYYNFYDKPEFPPDAESNQTYVERRSKKAGYYLKKESQELKLEDMIKSESLIFSDERKYAPVKKLSQEMKIEKQHTATKDFVPILCVIFEKGTSVVASVKTFFQML